MDEELLELQRQFEFAQQVKSSVRLSERNVVELVQKLQELGIIDFDLLHTTSGKEYITSDELRREIASEVENRGRVSLIDLAEATVMDLYHVEKQSQQVVADDSSLVLINGEIISNSYWDTVCEDINERLQECSQISLAEIAAQLQVGSELILSVIEPRLGTLVKGRLEGGQLYTPAYVARLTAMVRGAARGIAAPTNLPVLWSSLRGLLQDMDGFKGVAIESSFFHTLFNGILKEGEILGTLAGAHWTPSVFAIAQIECVDSFFSQNSFISYETLHKLGIPKPAQFLQSRYPEAQPLTTVFTHSSLIEMVGTAVEEAIERGSWINALALLPSSFASQDAYKILSLCPSVQRALKSGKAHLLGECYVFSENFVKELFASIDKELEGMDTSGFAATGSSDDSHFIIESKPLHNDRNDSAKQDEYDNRSMISVSASEKGSKKKKGKPNENFKSPVVENAIDSQDSSLKSKKNQKKGKSSSGQVSEAKISSKRETEKMEIPSFLSEESIVQRLRSLILDFDEQGVEDPETALISLSNYLRPMLFNSWTQRKKSAFSENSQKAKQVLDDLQRRLDEEFLNIQLYEKALDLFEDDMSTSVLLHKHLLRTTGASIVDALLLNIDLHNQLSNGNFMVQSRNECMSHSDRISLAKSLPEPVTVRAIKLVDTLEGKRVESFMIAVREIAEKSGITLKKLDKKMERSLLHSYRKDLTSQVSSETDPVSLLPKVVSLLYVQAHGRALQAPGRAISAAISHLKDKVDDSGFKILSDYRACTVKLLSLVSAGTGQEDAISKEREELESSMEALKSLVTGNNTSHP